MTIKEGKKFGKHLKSFGKPLPYPFELRERKF
jgi:hypothetical protein